MVDCRCAHQRCGVGADRIRPFVRHRSVRRGDADCFASLAMTAGCFCSFVSGFACGIFTFSRALCTRRGSPPVPAISPKMHTVRRSGSHTHAVRGIARRKKRSPETSPDFVYMYAVINQFALRTDAMILAPPISSSLVSSASIGSSMTSCVASSSAGMCLRCSRIESVRNSSLVCREMMIR